MTKQLMREALMEVDDKKFKAEALRTDSFVAEIRLVEKVKVI